MHNLYYISNFEVATKSLAIKYLRGKKLRSLKLVTKKSVIDQSGNRGCSLIRLDEHSTAWRKKYDKQCNILPWVRLLLMT